MVMERDVVVVRLPGVVKSCARAARTTWVDIETRKVECAPNDVLRRKWEPFLIGIGFLFDGELCVEMSWNWSDGDWACWFNGLKDRSDEMIYAATREFDEMVLKGRFTNARRAHLAKRPRDWRGIEEDRFHWVNIRKIQRPALSRGIDVESRLVPDAWARGEEMKVFVHLFRDVVELVLRDPMVVGFCGKLLTDFGVCAQLIEESSE